VIRTPLKNSLWLTDGEPGVSRWRLRPVGCCLGPGSVTISPHRPTFANSTTGNPRFTATVSANRIKSPLGIDINVSNCREPSRRSLASHIHNFKNTAARIQPGAFETFFDQHAITLAEFTLVLNVLKVVLPRSREYLVRSRQRAGRWASGGASLCTT